MFPKPSDDTLTFNIIKAPRAICYRDFFSAQVAVALTPEGTLAAISMQLVLLGVGTYFYTLLIAVLAFRSDHCF